MIFFVLVFLFGFLRGFRLGSSFVTTVRVRRTAVVALSVLLMGRRIFLFAVVSAWTLGCRWTDEVGLVLGGESPPKNQMEPVPRIRAVRTPRKTFCLSCSFM